MSHCTNGYGWYFGKFILGFAGMYMLYVGLLKTNVPKCVCPARARQEARRKGKECCCNSSGSQDVVVVCKAKKSCNELAAVSSCHLEPQQDKCHKRTRRPVTVAAAPRNASSNHKCAPNCPVKRKVLSCRRYSSSSTAISKSASDCRNTPKCIPAPVLRRLHPPDGDPNYGELCFGKENKKVTYQVTDCSNDDHCGEPNNVKISVTFQDCVKFDVTMTEATNMLENSVAGSKHAITEKSSLKSCCCLRSNPAQNCSDPQVIGEFFVEMEPKNLNTPCSVQESIQSISCSESSAESEEEAQPIRKCSSENRPTTPGCNSSRRDRSSSRNRASDCPLLKISRGSIGKLSRKAESCKSKASSILGGILSLFTQPPCDRLPTPCGSQSFKCQDCCLTPRCPSGTNNCSKSNSQCSRQTFTQKFKRKPSQEASACSFNTYNVCGGRLQGGSQTSCRVLAKSDDSVDDFSDSEDEQNFTKASIRTTPPMESSKSKIFSDERVRPYHGNCNHCQRACGTRGGCDHHRCHQQNRIIFTM